MNFRLVWYLRLKLNYAYNTYKLHITDEQRVEHKCSMTVPRNVTVIKNFNILPSLT